MIKKKTTPYYNSVKNDRFFLYILVIRTAYLLIELQRAIRPNVLTFVVITQFWASRFIITIIILQYYILFCRAREVNGIDYKN